MSGTLRHVPVSSLLRDRVERGKRKATAEAERAFRRTRVSESDVRRLMRKEIA
jgi:hypothetical protein